MGRQRISHCVASTLSELQSSGFLTLGDSIGVALVGLLVYMQVGRSFGPWVKVLLVLASTDILGFMSRRDPSSYLFSYTRTCRPV
jgi:UPF0716 family protein affecting phage T7 exclusion